MWLLLSVKHLLVSWANSCWKVALSMHDQTQCINVLVSRCEKNPRKVQLEGGRKLLGSLFKTESQILQWKSLAAQTTLSMSPGEWGWSPHGQLPGRKIRVWVGHNILPKTPNLEHPAKTSLASSETKHSTAGACGEHIFQPWPSVCPLTTQKSR